MRPVLMTLAVLMTATVTLAQQTVVWTASPWEHVLRSSAPGKCEPVRLHSAANEYEPFRVIVSAGVEPVTAVNLVASDLLGPKGRIRARHLTFYREHYLNVSAPSLRSKAPTGWYPDALIPFLDPETGNDLQGARFEATPYTVEANCNQGYWVDVFVPERTPPGQYAGAVTVSSAGQTLATVPVSVSVRDFALPHTIALQSNFGSLGSRLCKKLAIDPNGPQLAAIEDLYIDAFLDHRAVPGSLGDIWPKVSDDGTVDDNLTGARLRRLIEDKHVNALKLPFSAKDPEKCKRDLRAHAAYLRQKGWLDLAYVYLRDEPNNAEDYETVRQQAALVKEADPGIGRMCTEQTVTSDEKWGNLYGAVNLWCPLWGLWDEKTARERQAQGEKLWSYTALCQREAPFWQVDFAPVSFRAPFWISWHYDIKGFLYWSSIYWDPYEDVWTKPHFRDKYWGEGMLVYPGTEAGIRGPVPSIRLKLIREALEDYEYMTLAAKQGKRAEVNAIVAVLTRSFTQWEQDPAAYQKAREALAGLVK